MSHPRTIAITGVTGLVGDGIARHILAAGAYVRALVRRPVAACHPRLSVVRCNLAAVDVDATADALRGCDAVIHAAAIIPGGRAAWTRAETEECFRVNTLGTRALLDAAVASGVPQYVLLSGARLARTMEMHDDGMPYATRHPYDTSKLCAELMAREFQNAGHIRSTILRISAPYGYRCAGDAVIPRFIRAAIAGDPLELWGSGVREQTFTFVADIARACDCALVRACGGTYTITGGGGATTMRALAEAVLRAFPHAQSSIVMTGIPDPEEGQRIACADGETRDMMGYTPAFDLDTGLSAIAAHLRLPAPARALVAEDVVLHTPSL